MTEEWRKVIGFPDYEVSNLGRIRSTEKNYYRERPNCKAHKVHKTGKILSAKPSKSMGYPEIHSRSLGTLRVHRLVAIAFIPNPDNLPQVNHIDSDRTNNHISNLEWCTQEHNMKHASMAGRCNPWNIRNRIDRAGILAAKDALAAGFLQKDIAKYFDVSPWTISQLNKGTLQYAKM